MTEPATEPTRELLLRRARELSSAPAEVSRAPSMEVLTLTAGGRRFGVETGHVQRILRHDAVCRLPFGGGHLLALVGSHGAAVPVADLGALVGDRPPQIEGPYVVILDGEHPPLGLLVEDVSEVADVELAGLHAAPTGVGAGLAVGITPDGVVVLDAERLLGDARLDHGAHTGPTSPSHPSEDHP